jgi:membrane protein
MLEHSQPVEPGRGRRAQWPSSIPLRGWRDIGIRVWRDVLRTNMFLTAGGLAFFAFLAIPSALSGLVALYGLIFDPSAVSRQIAAMEGLLPQEAIKLLSDQLTTITASSNSRLSVAFAISLVIALVSARSGTASLMTALDIAYDENEKRSLVRFELEALALTLAVTVFAIIALVLIAVVPAVLQLLSFGGYSKTVAAIIRWPILILLIAVALAAIYRFAPSREEPKWRWVTWGAAIATALWLGGSALFSLYVADFASYNKTYGSLGAVVVLLMWLYVSAFAVLLGAEINAEIEHQTERDSTTGPAEPMGRRGAVMADTLGETS